MGNVIWGGLSLITGRAYVVEKKTPNVQGKSFA